MAYDRTLALLADTTAADDIGMLIKIIDQIELPDDEEWPSAEIPDPTRHCKYWEGVGARELCHALEEKYRESPRMEIPEDFMTSY